jgi:hypothetical protein
MGHLKAAKSPTVSRVKNCRMWFAYLRRLLSVTMHSTSSSLQLVHGAPCSTTLQRTLRALQHWHAFDARLLTGLSRLLVLLLSPAAVDVRFCEVSWVSEAEESVILAEEELLQLERSGHESFHDHDRVQRRGMSKEGEMRGGEG